jgi:hypothetical protein
MGRRCRLVPRGANRIAFVRDDAPPPASQSAVKKTGRMCRGPDAHGCLRCAYRAIGLSVGRHTVGHRSLPPSSPWAGRDGEGRSGAKVAKGGLSPAQLSPLRRPESRGALIAFMAATSPAQAEATKAVVPGLSEPRC